jgi:hypothetical protein
MRSFLLVILYGLTAASGFSQKPLPEFGQIDMTDLQLQKCSFEPEANAMKLLDVQDVEFDFWGYGGRVEIKRRVRIKIFNEAGYRHASIKLPYYAKSGASKIETLRGVVYSLDKAGKVVTLPVENDDFFKQKSSAEVGMINFTFPNVKPGSVIEYSYTKTVNIPVLETWILQDDIPTAYANMTLETPVESGIMFKVFGTDSVTNKRDDLRQKWQRRIFTKENIPSFQPEPYMSSVKDNLYRVAFLVFPRGSYMTESSRSEKFAQSMWQLSANSFLNQEFFGAQIKKQIPGTEKLIDSALQLKSIAERVKFLYNSVKRRLPEKAEQTFYSFNLADAWNNKTGNSGELNMILLNLFQRANVQASPILVSTRNNGHVKMDFPSFAQLNGMNILAMDSTTNQVFVIDASNRWQSHLNPPMNILNRQALLLDPGNIRWIKISDPRPLLKQRVNITASFKEEGELEGQATVLFYDFAKLGLNDSLEKVENETMVINKNIDGLTILAEKVIHPEEEEKPAEQHFTFKHTLLKADNFYFINPQFLLSKRRNPFLAENRRTDIDFGCNQLLTFTFNLSLPPNYQVEFLPKSTIVRAPDSSFVFRRICESDNSAIYITQTFEIKNATFYKEDYPSLQDFFKRIYALMAEEIILKKK